jgi:quercetin dioxygenase-like cupin family protein
MAAVSTANAAHYHWGQSCDGWHLLATDDLSVIEERMPPGSVEQRHRHAYARQFFYVLDGEAVLELEGIRPAAPTRCATKAPRTCASW